MNSLIYLVSFSLLAAGDGEKVGLTTSIATEQERNFGMGHTGANAEYIQALRDAVLPVALLNFDLKATDRFVKLAWSTASETNNSHFILKRSSDGKQFTEIARIEGSGNSASTSYYQFIDHLPLMGQNYYKLEQVDYNGSKVSFKVIATNYQLNERKVSAYFSDEGVLCTNIEAAYQESPILITVSNMQGKTIASQHIKSVSGRAFHQFSDVSLNEGIYIVSVRLNDRIVNQKVVK